MSKIYVNYSVSDSKKARAISGADETDLRVLVTALLSAEKGYDTQAIVETTGLDASDVNASVKYWKGAGLVCLSDTKEGKIKTGETAAHKGGVITHSGVEEYTNEELVGILESNVRPAFVDEAQKVMGKMFNKNEVGKLIGIVDQLGFEEEAVLAILAYCVRLEKKSVSYAEKIAVTFHDQDISRADEVHAQIDYLERCNSNIEKIRGIFGFGGRALTATEKKYFTAWTEELGFDLDIIRRAYELTVDSIHEPVPKYTNKILTNWHENGLKTLDEVEKFIISDRPEPKAAVSVRPSRQPMANQRSGKEVDDWFEQRLRKQFGDGNN